MILFSIGIIHPQQFLNKLQHVTFKSFLAKKLSHMQPTHAELLCGNAYAMQACGVLHPKVVGVIYNPDTFSVSLFINRRYVVTPMVGGYQLLPNSSVGWSYSNALGMVVSGITRSSENQASRNYTLSTENILAKGNARLNANFSVYHTTQVSDQDSALSLNQLNAEWDQGAYNYAAGLLIAGGNNPFFNDLSLLGGRFKTTENTLSYTNQLNAVPLIIFNSLPSQVDVYKDNKLIYSNALPGGYQTINTDDFPSGAYQVKIVSTDSHANTTTQRVFFVKTNVLPPRHFAQYSIAAGDLVSANAGSGRLINSIDRPAVTEGYQKRLGRLFGLQINAIQTNRDLLLSPGLVWLYEGVQDNVALLVGNHNRYGMSDSLQYDMSRLQLTATYLQVFNNHDFDNSGDAVNALALEGQQVSGNINDEMVDHISLMGFGSYYHAFNTAQSYHYGVGTQKMWNTGSDTQVGLNLTTGYDSSAGYNANISLSLNFNSSHVAASAQLGYLHQQTPAMGSNNTGLNALQVGGSATWISNAQSQYGTQVTLNASHQQGQQSVGASYQNISHATNINLYSHYNHSFGGTGFMQYGAQLNTQFSWAKGVWTLSNTSFGGQSGIIITVRSHDPKALFLLRGADYPIKIPANRKVFVGLSPYRQYDLTLLNASTHFFDLARPERSVVIYPGNIDRITWHAVRKVIVVGRLKTPAGPFAKRIAIQQHVGAVYTDSQGYFQAAISQRHQKLIAHIQQHNCLIVLPKPLDINKQFIYMGVVSCHFIR